MKPHLIAALLFVTAGCAQNRPSPMPPPLVNGPQVNTNFHRVELEPKWREFVLDHYQAAVKASLVVPDAAQFAAPESMVQSVDPKANRVALVASGLVYTRNRDGVQVLSKYLIFWDRPSDGFTSDEPGGGGEAHVYPVTPKDAFHDLSY